LTDRTQIAVRSRSRLLDRQCINLWGAFGLLTAVSEGRSGSVVTLLADSGGRYDDTYFHDKWDSAQGLEPTGPAEMLVEFERNCKWI
jgi:cysteine synthase